MTTFTAKETAVLNALIAAYETEYNGWGTVYLDNADHGLDERSFAGVLGSLAKKGVYEDEEDSNGCFGAVKLDALEGEEEVVDVYADMSVMGIAEDCFAEHGLTDAAVDMMVAIMAQHPGKTKSAAYAKNPRSFCRGYIAGAKRGA